MNATLFQRGNGLLLVVLLGLALGTVLCVFALSGERSWLRVPASALAASAAVAWLILDKRVEGAVLLRVARGHGLTVADLVALPALGLVALLTVLAYRDR